jgi:hypothetical protein
VEKGGEGWRRVKKGGEGWRRVEKGGEGWRRVEKGGVVEKGTCGKINCASASPDPYSPKHPTWRRGSNGCPTDFQRISNGYMEEGDPADG